MSEEEMEKQEEIEKEVEVSVGSEEENEEELGVYFTNARVVKILKEYNPNKRINKRVKVELNKLLEGIARSVSQKLGDLAFSTITLSDFEAAAKEYYELKKINQERRRVIKTLEKLKEDVEFLVTDLSERVDEEEE